MTAANETATSRVRPNLRPSGPACSVSACGAGVSLTGVL